MQENEPDLEVHFITCSICKEGKLTTKVEIVFHASCHDNNDLSLNDRLWPGTNLNPLLFDILIHFRLYEIAFSSDIQKAFLQISLAEKDHDYVRFLRYDDALRSFKVFRFNRDIFGVNASPVDLSTTINPFATGAIYEMFIILLPVLKNRTLCLFKSGKCSD